MKCINCRYYNSESRSCKLQGKQSPIRNCISGINNNLIEQIKKKKGKVRLLEIGCGSWSYVLENAPSNLSWRGIDVEKIDFKKRKTLATKIGSVEKIPYKNESFDYVLCNQSIEHWYEWGVSFKSALSEISRVLKKRGELWINAPIFLHGHKYFVKGHIEKIRCLFNRKYWKMLSLEEWRKEPYPLLAYYGWKSAYPKSLLNNKSTYILNIILEKKKTITLGIYDIIIKNIYKSLVFFIPKRYRKGLTYIGWRYIIYKIFKANDK